MSRFAWTRVSGIAGTLVVVIGCSSPPATQPQATLASAPPATVVAITPGATDVQLVNGSIDNIAGHMLSVSTNTGLVDVQIAEDANIETEGKGTPTDLQPGVGVAITGRPDGSTVTALSIRIIPAGLGTPRPGQFPMTGANQGNLMTNSIVSKFDGSTLTVDAAGQQFSLAVTPTTQITKPVPANLNDLAPGERVLLRTVRDPAGALRASTIDIVGAPLQ